MIIKTILPTKIKYEYVDNGMISVDNKKRIIEIGSHNFTVAQKNDCFVLNDVGTTVAILRRK